MKRLAALAGLLALAAGTAFAVILPLRISFQGKLIDPTTNQPRNGNVSMQFKIYDVPTGGAALASDPVGGGFVNVPVNNGVFSYAIGTGTLLTADMFRGASVYVGVTVNGDSEMTPRLPLSMAAYAFTAMQLVSDSDIRVNSGIAYSTFTTAGNLLVGSGVVAGTAAFQAQGSSVYSIVSSSGIHMTSGTLRVGAGSFGVDASGTGIVASTGTFLGWGNGTFSIVTSSGINIQNGTLQVDATGGIQADFGIVASTAFLRSGFNGVYGLTVSSGMIMSSGTFAMNGGGGIDVRYGVVASTGLFDAVVLSTAAGLVSITADNTLITVGPNTASAASYIKLTSNNATSTNRTFCLSAGRPGQILVLTWNDQGTNEGELLDGSISGAGSCTAAGGAVVAQLAAVWPAATNQPNDSIILVFDGNFWVEVGRAAN